MSDIPQQIEAIRKPYIDQIAAIEKEIRETPYHKGTEHHIGLLRAKLSRLKDKEIVSSSKKSGGGIGYAVKKQGDATIVLIGPPSAGKSTLINKLTNAQSKVAPYAFTTVSVIPGMMLLNGARIQILDVPGLIEGAEEGKGRGREVLSVARGADLLIIMSDVGRPAALERISAALEKNGIRLNKVPPNVTIEKKAQGGILVRYSIKQDIDRETVANIAQEFGVKNGEITLKEKLTLDRLIDAFSLSRVYIPAIYILNKADEKRKVKQGYPQNTRFISAEKGDGLDELKEKFWEILNFAKVYLVKPYQEPDLQNPIITKKETTLKDVAESIGSEFAQEKTSAKIWGTGAKFPSQEVSLQTKVQEGMQIRFV